MTRCLAVLLLAALLMAPAGPISAVTMDWVPVGDPGNAPDTASNCVYTVDCGSVANAYRISKYEVTNAQYAEFLNAVDPGGSNTLALYNARMGTDATFGGIRFDAGNAPGAKYSVKAGFANKPVNFVSFYDALRFSNWLNNGQGAASTETGAYTLLGNTPTPSNGATVTRNTLATLGGPAITFLPSLNEWYKAAYFSPAGTYFDYPTGTNTATSCVAAAADTGNSANCTGAGSVLTDVGAYGRSSSPYGTFDQGGNVFEWNETTDGGVRRGIRGGSWFHPASKTAADFVDQADPPHEDSDIGFRVAAAAQLTLFTTQTPAATGVHDAQAYELGMKFQSSEGGQITAIRYWKDALDPGPHVGHVWSSSGTLLANATFAGETASGWQQQNLDAGPLVILANTIYVVSVNSEFYVGTAGGLSFPVSNGPLSSIADGANGVFGLPPPTFPMQSTGSANYFRDVAFTPDLPSSTSTTTSTTVPPTTTSTSTTVPGAPTTTSTTLPVPTTTSTTTVVPTTTSTTVATLPPQSVWPPTATPTAFAGADVPVELGVKFRSDVAGYITGIRFYKHALNTGTHTGSLWDTAGNRLAQATFTSEAGSGWQQVTFASPVVIAANTVYIASYFCPDGHYAISMNFFASAGVDNPPLHLLANGVAGPNGVYTYAATSTFPASSYVSSNYWVDVIFSATAPPTTTTTSTSTTTSTTVPPTTTSTSTTVPGAPTTTSTTLPVPTTTTSTSTTTTTLPAQSVWPPTATPPVFAGADVPVELGVKFRSDVAGYVTGIRFYKNALNGGTHTGSLWDTAGNRLAQATFTGETPSGWQQVTFASPVLIAANTTYIASYFCPGGYFAISTNFFVSAGVDNPPLHLLANGVAGPNGVYTYAATSTFPASSYATSNYWVDVVFSATAPPATTSTTVPPTTTTTSTTVPPPPTTTTTPSPTTTSTTLPGAVNCGGSTVQVLWWDRGNNGGLNAAPCTSGSNPAGYLASAIVSAFDGTAGASVRCGLFDAVTKQKLCESAAKTTTAGDNTFTLIGCPVIAPGRALEMACGTNSASLGYGTSTCSSAGGERIQGGVYSCCTNTLPASWNPVPSGCIHRRWVVLTPL